MIPVSVIMATYNRGDLLERSLECYNLQTFKDFELIILDDESSDNTKEICLKWSDKLTINYERLAKPPDIKWRDAGCLYNLGLRKAQGNIAICTHPEIMPGFKVMEWLSTQIDNHMVYLHCKPFYLTRKVQHFMDEIPWKERGVNAIKNHPSWGSMFEQGFNPYLVDTTPTWRYWVFGGLTMETWKYIGGASETPHWGTGDLDFQMRRKILGIQDVCSTDPDTYVIHQNHDKNDIGMPENTKDYNDCVACLQQYHFVEEAIHNYL
jgi:hypothetical protein